MTVQEFVLIFYLYNMIPRQSRHYARYWTAVVLEYLKMYILCMPGLAMGIYRQTVRPNDVPIVYKTQEITGEGWYDNISGSVGCFDRMQRVVHLTRYVVNVPNHDVARYIRHDVELFEKMIYAHEMRHAATAPYNTSLFWCKRNLYYMGVLGEISSIIAEHFAGQLPEKRAKFERLVLTSDKMRGRIMHTAVQRFETAMVPWCQDISNIKKYHLPFFADFYSLPISFKRARRKMLTFDVGGKSVSFYDEISDKDRAKFDAWVYSFVDLICENTR